MREESTFLRSIIVRLMWRAGVGGTEMDGIQGEEEIRTQKHYHNRPLNHYEETNLPTRDKWQSKVLSRSQRGLLEVN